MNIYRNPIPKLLEDKAVAKIANRLNRAPAQILLKWILQRDIAAIPKSTNPERLRQNLDLFNFSLSNDDMNELGTLDRDCRLCDFSFFKGYIVTFNANSYGYVLICLFFLF